MKIGFLFQHTFKALRKTISPDVRKSVDLSIPSMPMVEACRADDFDFFAPFIAAGDLTVRQMRHACQRYFLGKTKSGQPIFWMIDDMLTPLDAHIGSTAWMSSLLKAREPLIASWQVTHCLFGLHLLCHTEITETTEILSVPKALSEISEISVCDKKSVGSVRSVCDLDASLFAYNLRGLGFEKRREMVEAAVRTVKPDIVIIDGIKDLITDINDAVQATQIMEHLMALAQRYNCCMVNVLHQNKSEADRNMRGSIGTELTNKAFEVYECEYLERHKLFRVTQTLSRRQRMSRRLCYVLSKEGLPETCEEPQEQPRDELGRWVSVKSKSESLVKLFNEAMEGRTQRKFNELMAVALKKCGVTDAQAYYALVKEAEEQGIIRKAIHPDTKESWVVLNDDSVLPF